MAAASSSFAVAPSARDRALLPSERWSGWTLLVWQVGTLVRGRGTVWKRSLWVGFFFLFSFLWLYEANAAWSGGVGRQGFRSLMKVNGWMLVGMGSSFSMVVSREREEGHLDLLRISGLSSAGLLLALSTSQFVRVVFAWMLQVPLIALCLTLGGLSLREVAFTYGLLFAVAFFLCHVGMLMSVLSRTSRQASQNTIGLCLCLYLWPMLLQKSVSIFSFQLPAGIFSIVSGWNQVNPWNAYQQLTTTGQFPLAAIIFHLGAGLLLLPLAAAWLERTCERREAAGEVARPKSQARAGKQRPRVGRWAVAWKEYYFAAGGPWWVYFRWGIYLLTVLGLTMLLCLASTQTGYALTWQPGAWVTVGLLGLLVEVPLACTRMLGAEVVNRTLGDLCMLPISFGRLMGEKLLGYLRCILVPALILMIGWATLSPHSLFIEIWQDCRWDFVAYGLAQAALLMVLTLALSLTKPSKAFSQAVALVFMVHMLSWLGLVASGWRPEFNAPLMAALTAGTTGLIVWQVRRVQWKLEEVAAR